MHSNKYTFFFALAVCVTCSVLLAVAAQSLKPTIKRNIELDIHKNILIAVDLLNPEEKVTADKVESLYSKVIAGQVIDASGNPVSGKNPTKLDPKTDSGLLPVFLRMDGSKIDAYCIPIQGKGLWSTIYGYLALEPDGNTVKGITFYKHGETPGLGGEIDKSKFKNNFKGKKIFDDQGTLVSIEVAKGRIPANLDPEKRSHKVDGISGATLTGKGITVFLREDLKRYLPYLNKIRGSQGRK